MQKTNKLPELIQERLKELKSFGYKFVNFNEKDSTFVVSQIIDMRASGEYVNGQTIYRKFKKVGEKMLFTAHEFKYFTNLETKKAYIDSWEINIAYNDVTRLETQRCCEEAKLIKLV